MGVKQWMLFSREEQDTAHEGRAAYRSYTERMMSGARGEYRCVETRLETDRGGQERNEGERNRMDRHRQGKKHIVKWSSFIPKVGFNQGGEIAECVRTMTQRAYDAGVAMGSNRVTGSHMKYWHDFCEVMGINADRFGGMESRMTQDPTGQTQLELLEGEISIFCMFATYIVYFPRRRRGIADCNATSYAEQVISSVRTHYALQNGRRPGLVEGSQGSSRLRRVLKGLSKMRPTTKAHRLPILQHHLRGIKKNLDLKNNQTHRVLWALWLTQWQGVMRSGDLIKRRADHKRLWDPELDTHRGRLSVDLGKNTAGKTVGARISLRLKPNKTDQAGVKGTVKTFIVDPHPDALSAGEAMRQMLKGDRVSGAPTQTPLFRDPITRGEITYEDSAAALKRCLRASGYPEMARGVHCLRIGGATAYANSPAGGPVISGFMGLWQSDAHYDYLHACSPRLEQAGLAVGREKGMQLAERPGPVSSYARAGY